MLCIFVLTWVGGLVAIFDLLDDWYYNYKEKRRDPMKEELERQRKKAKELLELAHGKKKILGYSRWVFFMYCGITGMNVGIVSNGFRHPDPHSYSWTVVVAVTIFMWMSVPLFRWGEEREKRRQQKQKWKEEIRGPKPKKPKNPNIFWEYLKAKKGKLCPLIAWDD